MKKLLLTGMILVSVLALWGWKKTKSSMTVVLPEKTVFFIDQDLSDSFKNNLTSSIVQSYSVSKDPAQVMEQVTSQFPEIYSMKVQICQSDKICFYVDAAVPFFLLNHEFVVCDNAQKITSDHFLSEIVEKLVPISCESVHDLKTMLNFVQALPQKFKERFSIAWHADSDIVLQPKDSNDFALLVSVQNPPSLQDLKLCEAIGAGLPKKLKSKKRRMVYDLRFKNQIIVR